MPGGWEWLIILAVVLLLFGAKRLPEMARSVGQSARVFKGEMKGLRDDEGRNAPQGATGPSDTARRSGTADRATDPAITDGQVNGQGVRDVDGTVNGTPAGEPVRRDVER
jgi:sec-independent protein translocase protein TatA